MILPKPPSSHEKYLYVGQNKAFLYSFGLISFFILIFGMYLFSVQNFYFGVYLFFTILMTVYLGISYFIGIFGKSFDLSKHFRILNAGYPAADVDVYLPSCGEPIEILANTYKYVKELQWHYGKLKVYVLDDSRRVEVESLADKFGFEYISRPEPRELKKAGNLRYAFTRTQGDFFLVLDADFCPRWDMLLDMMPYFRDEKVAIVQSPQYFEIQKGQSWVEKGSAYVQELFYRMVQTNRDTWGAAICVGTCAIYRRVALEPFGGTAAIAYSEDLHTGFSVLETGWKVKYIPVNLAKGVCPDLMSSYFVQQTRWCTGSTTLFTSKRFWKAPITFMQRLCYLSGGLYYWSTALGVFLVPIPGIIMVWFFPDRVFWYNYLFSVPSFLYGTILMALWARAPFGWYALGARQVAYYAHLYAIIDKIKGSMIPWLPTGQSGGMKSVKRYHDYKQVMFYWVSLATVLSLAGAFYRMQDLADFNFYPIIFFALFHYWVSISTFKEES